jgi:hypothetical protein
MEMHQGFHHHPRYFWMAQVAFPHAVIQIPLDLPLELATDLLPFRGLTLWPEDTQLLRLFTFELK